MEKKIKLSLGYNEIGFNSVSNELYNFEGYIVTKNHKLFSSTIGGKASELRLSSNVNLSFRKDSDGDLNIPLTIDHRGNLGSVVGQFVGVIEDGVGFMGSANVTDPLIAQKIKDKTYKSMSIEMNVSDFSVDNNIEYITAGEVTAVSLVSVPADSQAVIKKINFSSHVADKITDYSDELRNLGMSNKEANCFISSFKKFMANEGVADLNKLKDDNGKLKLEKEELMSIISKYKSIRELDNGR